MSGHVIDVDARVDVAALDRSALVALAARALTLESQPPSELSIVLADDATVRRLNRDYRGVDTATDVLSFAQADGDAFARPPGELPHIGDVIISMETAARQAIEYGVPLPDEVGHLLVHGVLHLLGHDHEAAEDAVVMRAREDTVLGEAHHH